MFKNSLLLKTSSESVLITAGGRKLYRHESDMGTVMEFNDGKDRKVLVLDAQYRVRDVMMTSKYNDTSLPNYTTYKNTNDTYYINGGSSATTPSACSSLTDNTLNSLWVNSIDVNTSKYNTDVWLTQPDCECATHCRSIKVNGTGCDIPNFQTLLRIFCEGVLLDELDPTVSSYPDLKLSDWLSSVDLWTSSENSKYLVREMSSAGYLRDGWKDSKCSVCPVLEL